MAEPPQKRSPMFGWGVKTVSVGELAEKLAEGKPVLIDVREPREFASGHVKGSVNIPLGALAAKAGKYDSGTDTYLICHSGNRSASAARVLQRAGFEHAYSVKGGIAAWTGRLVR
jgi:rhodanese-related sulfurtransferase